MSKIVWLRGVLVVAVASVGGGLAGCAAPAPLVSLRPRGAAVVWVAGRASVQQEEDGVRVAAAFEHQDGENLAVRVEVQNGTDHQIEVGPRHITFTACTDSTPTSCSGPSPVVDPEAELAAVDRQQSIDVASSENAAVVHGSLLLLSALADVATVSSGKADGTTGRQTAAVADEIETDQQRRDTALSSFAVQREFWSNVAFRRSTLFPSSGYGGLVFIPIDPKVRYLWLDVWAPERHRFRFQFEQVVTPVASTGSHADPFQSSVATSTRR